MAKKASKTAAKVAAKKTPKSTKKSGRRPLAGTSQRKTKKKIETPVYDFTLRGLAEALALCTFRIVEAVNAQTAELKRIADCLDGLSVDDLLSDGSQKQSEFEKHVAEELRTQPETEVAVEPYDAPVPSASELLDHEPVGYSS